jgi:hypothetical protein
MEEDMIDDMVFSDNSGSPIPVPTDEFDDYLKINSELEQHSPDCLILKKNNSAEKRVMKV